METVFVCDAYESKFNGIEKIRLNTMQWLAFNSCRDSMKKTAKNEKNLVEGMSFPGFDN